MLEVWVQHAGPLLLQSLSATVAIVSGTFFLYSLTRDISNRVGRTFSALLFFVTITYIGDLGVSYTGSLVTAERWLRFQWLGIAFVPAAYVHLSDSILTLTGLPSRGRRRWFVRSLYGVAALFFAMVVFSDLVVRDPLAEPAPHMIAGEAFGLFVAYFVSAVTLSLWFVLRARGRALISTNRRRLTYLLVPYLAPALAVFPFLLITGRAAFSATFFFAVLAIFDAILVIMLSFMAYPLAFFGARLPDRLVKAQMLQFFLRGPMVAIAALAVIIWAPRASGILGLPGDEVMPVIAVMVILFLQWTITLIRPWLERWLIYVDDQTEIRQIQELEERLLTGADFKQILDTLLVTICEFLRIHSAFVLSFTSGHAHLERALGMSEGFPAELERDQQLQPDSLREMLPDHAEVIPREGVFQWQDYLLIPLHYRGEEDAAPRLVGLLGLSNPVPYREKRMEEERWRMLMGLATRCAEVLEDRHLQSQVFAALDGLLPRIVAVQGLREGAEYRRSQFSSGEDEFTIDPEFAQKIKEALTHYWGGPHLTDSSLMGLQVVRQALTENEGNPQRAMRSVLLKAIERLKPEGQRSMTMTEWILYNILEMRFVQGRKVRDVAIRLAMSESDLYRKQRVAIEAVAEVVMDMEKDSDKLSADTLKTPLPDMTA
jgi:GAF domain-containing protein